MDMYSAYMGILNVFWYCMIFMSIMTVAMVVFAIIFKKKTDKIIAEKEKEYQNSLKIISEVPMRDDGCNVDKVIADLEKNNIDMSCKYKLSK
jgi:ABC-type bacteriocin/lantibiotic exporter with double-glycine peptidase domain